ALVVSVAHAVREGLTRLKSIANPMFNQAQNMLKPVADALDAATVQVNRVIDQGRAAIKGLNIDASKPLFDANRAINESTKSLDNGLLGAVQSAGAHAVAARSTAALFAMPETLPKPQQLTAGTPDFAWHLLGTSGSGKEKEAAVVNGDAASDVETVSSAQLSASRPSVVVDSEPSAPHAVESVKDTAKEDLKTAPKDDAKDRDRSLKPLVKEGQPDKADQSLNKQVTDTQNTGSIGASTTTNTDASAAAAKTDSTKSVADAASKAPKSKQDNDSGQHQEASKGKEKLAKPVVKEKLQDKVDKANSALKDSATGSIKQTRGAITSTGTNTDGSATSTKTEGAKSASAADATGSSAGAKTKQGNDSHDNPATSRKTGSSKPASAADSSTSSVTKNDSDSGKHHEDSSGASNKVKVKVASPSESGGKHRTAGASSGGGS
ncbi:MAG: hypothetical protein ACRDDJ_09500, partial [[Mycobacterium] stephanolepidis]